MLTPERKVEILKRMEDLMAESTQMEHRLSEILREIAGYAEEVAESRFEKEHIN